MADVKDTQWRRWQVFKQESASKPHQAVGSVHAADEEHALLTARNVFARRPKAVSMWVAPAEAVFSRTSEQLAATPDLAHREEAKEKMPYLVFHKTGHRRSMAFVQYQGELNASNPEQALQQALKTFGSENVVSWWLIPKKVVVQSSDDDVESWFEPAESKTYKQQSNYGQIGTHPSQRNEVSDER